MSSTGVNDPIGLIYREVIQYINGSSTSVPAVIDFVATDDQPLETLAAMLDACLWRMAVELIEARGRDGAVEYARGMLLHNELSRIENKAA